MKDFLERFGRSLNPTTSPRLLKAVTDTVALLWAKPKDNEEQPGYIRLAFQWGLDINNVAGPISAELVVLTSVDHEFHCNPIGRVRLHFRRRAPRYVSSRGPARASIEW